MPSIHTTAATGSRGCGRRVAGGLYVCTALSSDGSPLEDFLIDPVMEVPLAPFRAPITIERNGIKHLMVWVGESHYPSPADYVEETRRKGASRRIPMGFDLSGLTPGQSRMIMVHPKAFSKETSVATTCPTGVHINQNAPCIGSHWHWATSMGTPEHNGCGVIGDVSYPLAMPQYPHPRDCAPGAFLQLPITHLEYQKRSSNDDGPKSLMHYDQDWLLVKVHDPDVRDAFDEEEA